MHLENILKLMSNIPFILAQLVLSHITIAGDGIYGYNMLNSEVKHVKG